MKMIHDHMYIFSPSLKVGEWIFVKDSIKPIIITKIDENMALTYRNPTRWEMFKFKLINIWKRLAKQQI